MLAIPALAGADVAARPYRVSEYDAQITPDMAAKTLSGSVRIRLTAAADGLSSIELDCGALQADEVREGNQPARFESANGTLRVALSVPAKAGEQRELFIRYHGRPERGVKFYPEQVYTVFTTHEWLISNDRPEERAKLTLRLTVPAGYTAVASGRRINVPGRGRSLEDETITLWKQELPIPPFVFGFAIGRFQRASTKHGPVDMVFLGNRSPEELKRIFAATASALDFFTEVAGVPYPGLTYTQVLAQGKPEQEVGGFTLLPDAYGDELLKQPDDLWLLAHELSHQWWGISITCRDWSDFWLNEGLATFLADAFLERRYGKARYEHEIEISRGIYEKLQKAGRDRPLVYRDWQTPSQAGGSLPYHKGAYVLHLLRQELGDEVFWRGLRLYTRQNAGKRVVTADFQAAMEKASGRPLSEFFQKRVFSK